MASYMKDVELGILAVTREVSFVQGWNHFKNEEQMQGEMEDDEGHTLIIVPHQESRFRPTSGSRWVCEISLCPLNRHGRRILPAKLIKKVSAVAQKPVQAKPAVQAEPQRLEQPAPKDVLPSRRDEQKASLEVEQLLVEAEQERPIKPAQSRVGNGVVRQHKPKTKRQRREAASALS